MGSRPPPGTGRSIPALFSGDLIEIDHEKFIIEVENDRSKTENV